KLHFNTTNDGGTLALHGAKSSRTIYLWTSSGGTPVQTHRQPYRSWISRGRGDREVPGFARGAGHDSSTLSFVHLGALPVAFPQSAAAAAAAAGVAARNFVFFDLEFWLFWSFLLPFLFHQRLLVLRRPGPDFFNAGITYFLALVS
ncbi:hypothetical protein QBC44DRAFT_331624, partial [Cladorrhinum sp. PSN332]